jgi:flavin-dependent dehydrogenase
VSLSNKPYIFKTLIHFAKPYTSTTAAEVPLSPRQVDPAVHQEGTVLHTIGYPLGDTYGGSFLYHWTDNRVILGLVVGLDYKWAPSTDRLNCRRRSFRSLHLCSSSLYFVLQVRD